MHTITRTLISFFVMVSIAFLGYAFVIEPATVAAQSDTDQFYVNLTVDSAISLTDCADVTLLPNLGLTSHKSIGQTTCNVKTTDSNGYTLKIRDNINIFVIGSTMMNQGAGSNIDNLTVNGDTDLWSVDSNTVQFGFSAVGADVNHWLNDGDGAGGNGPEGSCVSDVNNLGSTNHGYAPVPSGWMQDIFISGSGVTTPFDGTDTTFCFAVEQNGVFADSGTYQASIQVTTTTQ